MTVVDMREEVKLGNRTIFSTHLRSLIQDRLEKKQQVMLFLNRRGFAGFVSCRSCGHVFKCPHCDVSMTEHFSGKPNAKLSCHYCGYEIMRPMVCPECQSKMIAGFGLGTQKVEEYVKSVFPEARVLRMDTDTTKNKDAHEKLLGQFANGEADILVGTQMIVKGHDFKNVTLVGVLMADISMYEADYRAGERALQILSQAAGRAGRGEKPGEVVFQTYRPEHYSVVQAASQDYTAFYEEEMVYRELGDYPPASHMMAMLVTASDEKRGEALAIDVTKIAGEEKNINKEAGLRIIGPAKASIGKVNDIYRFVVYCKSADYERLISVKNRVEQYLAGKELKQEAVQFDFNPIDSY